MKTIMEVLLYKIVSFVAKKLCTMWDNEFAKNDSEVSGNDVMQYNSFIMQIRQISTVAFILLLLAVVIVSFTAFNGGQK